MISRDNEEVVNLLIQRYQQRIFALVLYLVGNDRDKVYDIAVSSFVEAFRTTVFPGECNTFLRRISSVAVEKSRDVKIIASSDEPDFTDLPKERRNSLFMLKKALQALPFDERAVLLLRDQLRISYEDISVVFRISERDARLQTTQARAHLRKKIAEML